MGLLTLIIKQIENTYGTLTADSLNFAFTTFWIYFSITALLVLVYSLFKQTKSNIFFIYEVNFSKKKIKELGKFYILHSLLFLSLSCYVYKTLGKLMKEGTWGFSFYNKYSQYTQSSQVTMDQFNSTDISGLNNYMAEILKTTGALGLGNGWGWDFLIPASSDFIGIVQLYLIIMTILITVSIIVTFMFKFSATDRIDQVGQLFHKFSLQLVRIPEYKIKQKSNVKEEEEITLFVDTIETRPEWEIDLENLNTYSMKKDQKKIFFNKKRRVRRSYFLIKEYLYRRSPIWGSICKNYDSLTAGRPRLKKNKIKLPTFIQKTPSNMIWNLDKRRWEKKSLIVRYNNKQYRYTRRRAKIFYRALHETFMGITLVSLWRNLIFSIVKFFKNFSIKSFFFSRLESFKKSVGETRELICANMRTFSNWEYKQFLRFEEKYYYVNQLLKFRETGVSKLKKDSVYGGSKSNYKFVRDLPPLEDFIWLYNKYFEWTYRGLVDDFVLFSNFLNKKIKEFNKLIGDIFNQKLITQLKTQWDFADHDVNLPIADQLSSTKLQIKNKTIDFTKNLDSSLNLSKKFNKINFNFNLKYTNKIIKYISKCYSILELPIIRYKKYTYRADLAKSTIPLFKFLTTHSVNRFWVYHSAIEFAWTIIPCLILIFVSIPSFALALALDENFKPQLWVKVIGNQWFWVYEYSTYDEYVVIDSVVQQGSDLKNNALRLLAPDTSVTIPYNKFVRFLVTSTDVIHSWAVPALGIKVDACPGRINSVSILPNRLGIFYGQCSEICGVNHAFMPIAVEVVA